MLILGVETSCDDTAAAIVEIRPIKGRRILANEVWTDHSDHSSFGGIVPEIAARSHVERLDIVIEAALRNAEIDISDLGAIAATAGPGLLGGVMVGLTAAKSLAITHDLPLIPINHLEGHALSVRMTEDVNYPYLLLLVSGGHTQLIAVNSVGDYERLGATIDDAAGEAFDKTAKLLGLGQPGGPMIEAAATGGNASRFKFPLPLAKRAGCDFSFSGLKTAVREAAEAIGDPTHQDVADIAASFQHATSAHLATQTKKAMERYSDDVEYQCLVVAGGVAANCTIKSALNDLCTMSDWRLCAPPAKYCTDNAAMIAWAGAERIIAGLQPEKPDSLAFPPRARWPLAPPPAGKEIGSGRKGPKA